MQSTMIPTTLVYDTKMKADNVWIWAIFAQDVKGRTCQTVAKEYKKPVKTIRKAAIELTRHGYLKKEKQGKEYIYSVAEKYKYSENGNVCDK